MKRALLNASMWLAGLVAILAILLMLLYAEEDWRGTRDWATCQKELAAKGETLDLRQLAPPGKPEDDLSKAPIFAPLYEKEPDSKAPIKQIDLYLQTPSSDQQPKFSQYMKGQSLDLTAWQTFYRSLPQAGISSSTGTSAQDVLQVLSRFDPQINDVDKAVSNPNAYFPIDYKSPLGTPFGGVTGMIRVAKFLEIRGIAHLENSEADLAEKDYLLSFRLNQPLTKNCFLVNYLVVAAVPSIANAILWEGLKHHAWNNTQLQEMESASASGDMLALAIKSYRTERASTIQTLNFLRDRDPKQLRGTEEMLFFRPRHEIANIHLVPSPKWLVASRPDPLHFGIANTDRLNSSHRRSTELV